MDVSVWYVILGIAIVIIAVIERFVVYQVLVGVRGWLPEKAGTLANICSGASLLCGIIVLVGNAVLSRR